MRSEELDKKKYVFLLPAEINIRPANREKKAVDIHIYELDEENKVLRSCCGSFNLDHRYHVSVKGMMAPQARAKAAEKGREICGRCVAGLYSNTDNTDD